MAQLQKAMLALNKNHGIICNAIAGYDSISYNDKKEERVTDHPGFKRMVETLNQNSEEMRSWLQNGTLLTNRKGLLWKHIESIPPKEKTHGQLVEQVLKWTPIVNEYNNLMMQQAISTQDPKGKPPSTRSILFAYRRDHDARKAMKRVIKQEKRMKKKEDQGDGSGEIYAASNPLTMGLHKQGFSFGDAETRVRGLQTAGVLEPFKLVRRAKVPDARLYEKAMHIYFKDVRVYKRKEFFATSNEEVNQFFDMVEADGGDDEQWACAIAKAKKARK